VRGRASYGGPAPEQTERQLALAAATLREEGKAIAALKKKL
jgi:hypothetical protein